MRKFLTNVTTPPKALLFLAATLRQFISRVEDVGMRIAVLYTTVVFGVMIWWARAIMLVRRWGSGFVSRPSWLLAGTVPRSMSDLKDTVYPKITSRCGEGVEVVEDWARKAIPAISRNLLEDSVRSTFSFHTECSTRSRAFSLVGT